jgi:predicted metal-dependent peptidase
MSDPRYQNLPDAFQAGRVILSQTHPYLSSALYRVIPVAKEGLGTMGVDKWWRLYFDPLCIWTPKQVATVLYHEMGHLLRGHSDRVGSRDHMGWNIAGDLEINDDIAAELGAKADWPLQPCFPGSFKLQDGETAEFYYDNLPKSKQNGQGSASGQPQPGKGECGSAAGNPGSWEDGPPPGESDPTTGEKGKDDAAAGIGQTESDMIKRKIAQDAQEHQRNRGDVPEWIKRWADEILNPVIPWQKVLAGFVRHAMADVSGMVNYTYQRPSRRQSAMSDVIMPAMRRPVPNLCCVVDTSGSMSEKDLAEVLGEVNGILKTAGAAGVDVLVADADVKSAKRVFKPSQIDMTGGGGTDMRVGIAAAMKRTPKPHVVIVLTDGETPWPDAPVSARVIAAIVGGYKGQVPDWIKRVDVVT